MNSLYDVIIIGAGPAGMSAALYASRANLKTLMIEKECPGGKLMRFKTIENYLGGSSTKAMELASNMFAQAIKFGAKYKQAEVIGIRNNLEDKEVILASEEVLKTRTLILAIGGKLTSNSFKYQHYLNRGLSYCVVCDASFYKDKIVALIGENKSIDEVAYLANIAKEVYFINKENEASNRENVINFINTSDYKILGKEKVEAIEVNGETLLVDGVFYIDDSNNFNGFIDNLKLDEGYIKVDKNMHTNLEGIYACGDIVNKRIKQAIIASSQGAIAALEAIMYVNKNK